MTQADRIQAVAQTAEAWRDPAHTTRAAAVEATLAAPNRFTEEGLAFALNHRMHQANEGALRAWAGDLEAEHSVEVGVVCEGEVPLAGWEAALAAFLLGHRAVVALADTSPALLPAFWAEVEGSDGLVRFGEDARLSETVIARQKTRSSVAVVDGREDAEALSGFAEDLLLHEGSGPAIVWAPSGLGPDALLNALAGFREFFPPHPDTDGTLALPTAFLASAKQSHATGPGFLVSKGDPEPQGPAHIRWSEYDALGEVAAWLQAEPGLSSVVATPELAERLDTDLPVVPPGDVHRPALGQRSPDLIPLLAGLSS